MDKFGHFVKICPKLKKSVLPYYAGFVRFGQIGFLICPCKIQAVIMVLVVLDKSGHFFAKYRGGYEKKYNENMNFSKNQFLFKRGIYLFLNLSKSVLLLLFIIYILYIIYIREREKWLSDKVFKTFCKNKNLHIFTKLGGHFQKSICPRIFKFP